MGKPFIIYDDEITRENMKEGTIYGHGCIFCKKTYICINLGQWHFCDHGYHGIAKNFICSACLTRGFQPG